MPWLIAGAVVVVAALAFGVWSLCAVSGDADDFLGYKGGE